jgi:excisionase family DNA binding protein
MDLPNEERVSYLNPKTGEIVTVTDEDRRFAESEDLDEDSLPEWERESLRIARAVVESGDCLALPDKTRRKISTYIRTLRPDVPAAVPHLLEVSHVAHRLSRSQGCVRRLIRSGKLKALRDGGVWRVELREYEAYLERCRRDALEAIRPAAVNPIPRASS